METDNDLCWFIEWGHAHNLIADAGFYPDNGPHGFHAMMRWLSSQGWAHVSPIWMG